MFKLANQTASKDLDSARLVAPKLQSSSIAQLSFTLDKPAVEKDGSPHSEKRFYFRSPKAATMETSQMGFQRKTYQSTKKHM